MPRGPRGLSPGMRRRSRHARAEPSGARRPGGVRLRAGPAGPGQRRWRCLLDSAHAVSEAPPAPSMFPAPGGQAHHRTFSTGPVSSWRRRRCATHPTPWRGRFAGIFARDPGSAVCGLRSAVCGLRSVVCRLTPCCCGPPAFKDGGGQGSVLGGRCGGRPGLPRVMNQASHEDQPLKDSAAQAGPPEPVPPPGHRAERPERRRRPTGRPRWRTRPAHVRGHDPLTNIILIVVTPTISSVCPERPVCEIRRSGDHGAERRINFRETRLRACPVGGPKRPESQVPGAAGPLVVRKGAGTGALAVHGLKKITAAA